MLPLISLISCLHKYIRGFGKKNVLTYKDTIFNSLIKRSPCTLFFTASLSIITFSNVNFVSKLFVPYLKGERADGRIFGLFDRRFVGLIDGWVIWKHDAIPDLAIAKTPSGA